MRYLLLLTLLGSFAFGQSLSTAVRQVARNILAPGEVAHVTERALAPEFAAETSRARVLLDRVLARPAIRDARVVEVVVTATADVAGPLLVVQIQRSGEPVVKTAAYTIQPVSRSAKPSLTATLLFQQPEPILDLTVAGDRMLVLSPAEAEEFVRAADGKWEATDATALEGLAPSRDPRGRLVTAESNVTAFLSGGTCSGKWVRPLEWTCNESSGEFDLDGEQVHFVSGENVLETGDGERIFSTARSEDLRLTAMADGTVRGTAGQANPFGDWGSDLAALGSRCLPAPVIVATSATELEAMTAYEAASPMRRFTDAMPMKGPVTALWPAPGGLLAVVHETAPERYAAYAVSLDCGN